VGGLTLETKCIFEYKPSPHFKLDVVYKMGGVLTGHYGVTRKFSQVQILAILQIFTIFNFITRISTNDHAPYDFKMVSTKIQRALQHGSDVKSMQQLLGT